MLSPVLPPKRLQAQGLQAPSSSQPLMPLCHLADHENDKENTVVPLLTQPPASVQPSLPPRPGLYGPLLPAFCYMVESSPLAGVGGEGETTRSEITQVQLCLVQHHLFKEPVPHPWRALS